MIWLLCAMAFAEDLTETVVTEEPINIGSVVYTSNHPIYLLPTPVFDKLLAEKLKSRSCLEGLERVEYNLGEARTKLQESQRTTAYALSASTEALSAASHQMQLDAENDLKQIEVILKLDEKLGKARSQRNVAVAVSAGIIGSLVAVELISR